MKSGRLVVKHHAPWEKPVLAMLGLLLAVGTGWGLYAWGQSKAGFDSIAAMETQSNMREAIVQLERQNAELRDQVALYGRSEQVDKKAYSDVDETLKQLQDEVLELREEVTFYRGIVSPKETSAGLRVERFKIESSGQERIFHYELVLTQVLKNDRMVRGRVKLTFEGVENDGPKELSLAAVSSSKQSSQEFTFRYFQKMDGDIVLPETFKPRKVRITVLPYQGKDLERNYDWPETSSGVAPSEQTTPVGEEH